VPLSGGRSLLEEAYRRLDGLVPDERRFVCGSKQHRSISLACVPELSRPSASGLDRYLGESEGRDTLAALVLSSAVIAHEDPDAVIAVFTADHVIRPEAELRALVDMAYRIVEEKPQMLVTFGVKPNRPSTGFGYLELGPQEAEGVWKVVRYLEKPDAESAKAFFVSGPDRYLWNSGLFVWSVSRFLELAERYEPELAKAVTRAASMSGSPEFGEVTASIYPSLKKISVDYGVMMRASVDDDASIVALPMSLNWFDIGSWTAYGLLLPKDREGNSRTGETVMVECRGDVVASFEEGHLVACLGCEDLVIVHTRDATLVCPKIKADELKNLYEKVLPYAGGRYT
jgi:mannose-1-phosphate guanylyltransferase